MRMTSELMEHGQKNAQSSSTNDKKMVGDHCVIKNREGAANGRYLEIKLL